jgi:predicted dehydrogenase
VAKFTALLVGAGGMGKAWARNLFSNPRVNLAGWMDIRPDAAPAAIAELKITGVQTFDDLAKAIEKTRPDFVVDVTIPEAHHEVTIQSLAAGIPVLGEKPMADSMDRARAMVRASERAGKLYMVSQSRRYDFNAIAFADLIHQRIGGVGILDSDFYLGPHFGGFREKMRSVLLLDMAIHTFDSARQISRQNPLSVYCEEFNPDWSWFEGNAGATAIFEMTGNLRYTYRGCWAAQGQHTSWQSQWRACGPQGSATWDGDHPPVAERITRPSPEQGNLFAPTEKIEAPPTPQNNHAGIAGSLKEFLTALETGATPQGECHDNIKSLAMVFAAVESAATGKRVKIQD